MQMIKIPYAMEREVNFHKRTNKTQELKQNSNAMQYIYIKWRPDVVEPKPQDITLLSWNRVSICAETILSHSMIPRQP